MNISSQIRSALAPVHRSISKFTRTELSGFLFAFVFLFSPRGLAITFVCDIDWTLVYHDAAEIFPQEPDNTMEVDNDHLRFSDYAAEAVELLRRYDVATVFFSGGHEDRNRLVMQALQKLTRTRIGIDRPPNQSIGFSSLTEVAPANSGLSFSMRLKKDLLKAVPATELPETVLADDDPRFALPGQEDHLFSFSSYKDKLSFSDYTVSHEVDPYSPPNFEAWLIERSKLLIFAEAIIEVKEARHPEVAFIEQLRQTLGVERESGGRLRLNEQNTNALGPFKAGPGSARFRRYSQLEII